MTSKERSYLKSLATNLQSVTQIGKGGISSTLLKCVEDALKAHELVKLSVLETSPTEPKEALSIICAELNAEPVIAIGRKIVLYKESEDKIIDLSAAR